eukprot:CAMPEP_0206306870 /NCGR_PEP_ID=MMETSP0106_2-20121207/11031_1 /ASSEMBLY_ACC=CAM_ASM_000206 /TAXON_ID=81532 /ORGANISM="Acanthoeca-like sp., Strain 10tr" /LENGTH=152 /DNA_ID=CAMNT_0053737821 /DNA_START=120 /DNA_END=579 /DNA_ORIENTATION=+
MGMPEKACYEGGKERDGAAVERHVFARARLFAGWNAAKAAFDQLLTSVSRRGPVGRHNCGDHPDGRDGAVHRYDGTSQNGSPLYLDRWTRCVGAGSRRGSGGSEAPEHRYTIHNNVHSGRDNQSELAKQLSGVYRGMVIDKSRPAEVERRFA